MRLLGIFLFAIFITLSANAQVEELCGSSMSYKGFVEVGGGSAYNLNTAQTVSTVNLQALLAVSTIHGVSYKNWFGGLGLGYYNPQRDNENQFLVFADTRYIFCKNKIKPAYGLKIGIIYDSGWIEKTQKYMALNGSFRLDEKLRLGLEASLFSRPSRHFTTNALVVVCYAIGK